MNVPSELDTSAALAYEAFLVPGLIAPWVDVIVSAAQIREGMEVLDVACGTGIAARQAARHVGSSGRAVGIDIDPGMLNVAKLTSMKEALAVEYGHASACDLPFKSESFDAVLCLQGLQYFPSPSKALHELRRVLRADALFVSVTWSEIHNCKGYWAMVSALERRQIDASAARKPFALADEMKLKSLATQAGFKTVSLRTEQRLGRFRSASAFLDAMLQAAPSSRLALEKVPTQDWPNFQAEVTDMLAPWQTGAGIEFPMACNVLVAS